MFSILARRALSLDACDESTMTSRTDISITISGTTKSFAAAYLVDGCSFTGSGQTYKSESTDENVFLVINGGQLTLTDSVLTKTGDCATEGSDDYNFYGLNSGIVVIGSGSSATLSNVTITTAASGANAVFASDEGSIEANTITISTTSDSSRGLDATYDGTIVAKGVNINTLGAHCACIATDRGEGTINVTGVSDNNMNQLATAGEGSPVIYSTGAITVNNVVGVATGSEGCVIEGKNSITLYNSQITGTTTAAVMLYQSMSGDADVGKTYFNLYASTVTISNNTLPFLYVTNTEASVGIYEGTSMVYGSGIFAYAGANRWGTSGSNGGTAVINITNVDVEGNAIASADDSSITINLEGSSSFTGGVYGDVTINNNGSGSIATATTDCPSLATQDGGSAQSNAPGGSQSGGFGPSPPSGDRPDLPGSNNSSNNSSSSSDNQDSSSLLSNGGQTALIVVLVVVCVALIAVSVVLVIVWRKNRVTAAMSDNTQDL